MAGDAAGNKATGADISCEGMYGQYLDNQMSLEEFGRTDAGMAMYNAKDLIDAMSDEDSYGFANVLQKGLCRLESMKAGRLAQNSPLDKEETR